MDTCDLACANPQNLPTGRALWSGGSLFRTHFPKLSPWGQGSGASHIRSDPLFILPPSTPSTCTYTDTQPHVHNQVSPPSIFLWVPRQAYMMSGGLLPTYQRLLYGQQIVQKLRKFVFVLQRSQTLQAMASLYLKPQWSNITNYGHK